MRQVPSYLLIGDGRVARHFQHYFSLLQLSFECWSRQEAIEKLSMRLSRATHVLVLIRDDAIETFINHYLSQANTLCIHFSGSLVSAQAYGAHPLMTFNQLLYEKESYERIPFVIDHDAPPFEALLPGLPNPHARLSTALKTKYHACCVLSGNFSSMLWQKLFSSLEKEFNMPASIAKPYLLQLTQNLLQDPATALTGPLVRGDEQVIKKHLSVLHDDPFKAVYESFVTCYQQLITARGEANENN